MNQKQLESKAANHYRLTAFRNRKKGLPVPDRATHIREYLAKHGQDAHHATTAPEPVSRQAPECQGRVGANGEGVATRDEMGVATVETPEARGAVPVVAGPAPIVPSPARNAPARLENGRFPARRPLTCNPAPIPAYEMACAMMHEGATFKAILAATGQTWAALNERGLADFPDSWPAVQQAWKTARALKVLDKACEVAAQAEPAQRTQTRGPTGDTASEQYRTDPAMIGQVLAGLLPSVHGRAAGKAPMQINVAGNAAILPAPPPGSLDDFDRYSQS